MAEGKERPIIFSTPLIPGLLDGSVTMTRRTRGLAMFNAHPEEWVAYQDAFGTWGFKNIRSLVIHKVICPFGEVGDRLWVKETHAIRNDGQQVLHKAGYLEVIKALDLPDIGIKWRSPRFMPRWASRIDLDITAVRLERLQEIKTSFIDLKAEGIPDDMLLPYMSNAFSILWDFLNAKRGYPWDMNHWVWVLGLKKEEDD